MSEALKQLLRVAKAAPAHLLHMRAFTETADCGTAFCLAGWASIDPWFRKNTKINDLLPANNEFPQFFVVDRERLAEIFDITGKQAEDLFALDIVTSAEPHAISKAEVVRQVKALIDGEDIRPYAYLR